ncbi:hypothetical protein NON20_21035 [Synechocystis sp. B12]|nr:hypothetical protein NON20_21035 [Synechocystis sp. B12]
MDSLPIILHQSHTQPNGDRQELGQTGKTERGKKATLSVLGRKDRH